MPEHEKKLAGGVAMITGVGAATFRLRRRARYHSYVM